MAATVIFKALAASLCLFSVVSASPFSKRGAAAAASLKEIQTQALENAYKVLDGTLSDGLIRSSTCNKDTIAVRKELQVLSANSPSYTLTQLSGDLTKAERKAYTDAVSCILKAPSKLPASQYPGAKSRYDDFVVVHMASSSPSPHYIQTNMALYPRT